MANNGLIASDPKPGISSACCPVQCPAAEPVARFWVITGFIDRFSLADLSCQCGRSARENHMPLCL